MNIGGAGLSLQQGESRSISGGNNGGGDGWVGSFNYPAASGGGGTDIRRKDNEIANRIIVAGGGGGAGAENSDSYEDQYGGFGGGLVGGNGGGRGDMEIDVATGGTRECGGKAGVISGQYGEDGDEFKGGMGAFSKNTASSAGGGGGGYFGGGGATSSGGGGGSGYIGGVMSFGTIRAETKSCNTTFPSPYGGEEDGHWGNGVIRITNIDNICTLFIPRKLDIYPIIFFVIVML